MLAWIGLQKNGPWIPVMSHQGQVVDLNGLDVQDETVHGVKLRSPVTVRATIQPMIMMFFFIKQIGFTFIPASPFRV